MLDRWQEEEPAELVFVLVGTEGERYDALLQIADGEASLLREGHDPSVGCRSFGLADPGIFELKDCSSASGTGSISSTGMSSNMRQSALVFHGVDQRRYVGG